MSAFTGLYRAKTSYLVWLLYAFVSVFGSRFSYSGAEGVAADQLEGQARRSRPNICNKHSSRARPLFLPLSLSGICRGSSCCWLHPSAEHGKRLQHANTSP